MVVVVAAVRARGHFCRSAAPFCSRYPLSRARVHTHSALFGRLQRQSQAAAFIVGFNYRCSRITTQASRPYPLQESHLTYR